MSGAPQGVNEQQVTEWMAVLLPELHPPLTFTLVAGGRSNLTFRVEDMDGRAWALRRPPLHHVLPTAHDMTREYRLISSLGPVGIPVPVAHGLCGQPRPGENEGLHPRLVPPRVVTPGRAPVAGAELGSQ